MARMRSPVDLSTLALAALALVLAGLAYMKDPGLPLIGARNGLSFLWFILPRLIPALIVAGMIQVLVPQEVVSRHFGHQAGMRALVIATVAGMLTPGGPMVSVPFMVALHLTRWVADRHGKVSRGSLRVLHRWPRKSEAVRVRTGVAETDSRDFRLGPPGPILAAWGRACLAWSFGARFRLLPRRFRRDAICRWPRRRGPEIRCGPSTPSGRSRFAATLAAFTAARARGGRGPTS